MWKSFISKLLHEENLYIQALHESQRMLDINLTMFEATIESLRNSDTGEISVDVYKIDEGINSYVRDIRKKILIHLSVTGTRDLALGLYLATVVIDIERIGDCTKNIYDMVKNHPLRLTAGELEERLQSVERHVTKYFKEMITVFKNSDEDMAQKLLVGYIDDISKQVDEISTRIVRGETTDLTPSDAAAVSLYSRYLERIAAHSRNIITSVVNPFERIGFKNKD